MGNVFHHTTTNQTLVDNDEAIIDEAEIIENHFHTYERWFGASGGAVGPGLQTSLTPFRVTSAAVANGFGNSITVLNGTETPVQTGRTKFDFHKIYIVDAENTNKTYRLRFADNHGGQSSYAAAVAAGYYSDMCFRLTVNSNRPSPAIMQYPRLPSRTIVWAALATLDATAQWLDFLVGLHEYLK